MKRVILLFSLLLVCRFTKAQDQKLIDSLFIAYSHEKVDTVKIMLLNDISWQYRTSDMNRSIQLADSALKQSLRINFNRGISKGFILKGVYYSMTGNYDSAVINYEQCRALRSSQGDTTGVAAALHDLGTVQLYRGNYERALDYFLQSLRIEEKFGTKRNIAEGYVNVGDVYLAMDNFDQALVYFNRYLTIQKDATEPGAICEVLCNVGNVYFNKKNYKLSEKYYLDAKKIAEQSGNNEAIAMCLAGLGDLYVVLDRDKEALNNYLGALDIFSSLGNAEAVADQYNSIAGMYLTGGNTGLAIQYADSALEIANEIGTKRHIRNAYEIKSKAYFKKGDFKNAYEFHEKYFIYNDSLINESSANKMAELQTVFETAKKENENKLLARENSIKDLELQRSHIQQYVLFGAIILIIIVGYLFYSRNKAIQGEIMNKALLEERELRSREVIEAEERERMRIAKDLHDGIGQMLSAAKMNLSNLENKLNVKGGEEKQLIENSLSLVDESVREVRSVSHAMMPNALIKSGLSKALHEFINKLNNPGLKFHLEVIGLDERLESTIETVLYRVIQEIVSNIIRHSKASEVNIQLLRHEEEIVLMVEDNGIGFDTSHVKDFSGIGLKNIQSRVAYLNGTVNFDSTVGKGTTVNIEIPL
ncbi:MAG: sensor histidine kinase [Bacteroidetes bacterium]|nr:sensor histidine kinase [Bacteroidota bacterium]